MAEIVDRIPQRATRARYPWDEWFDGRIWKLTQGEDFHATPYAVKEAARMQARRRNIEVELHVNDVHVYIHAIGAANAS